MPETLTLGSKSGSEEHSMQRLTKEPERNLFLANDFEGGVYIKATLTREL